VVVVNTGYVLAPHRRFPSPAEQIYDVLQWVSSAAREWDGTRVCVGGQSAGGNLSAAAAQHAELGEEPPRTLSPRMRMSLLRVVVQPCATVPQAS
jgi:acetyl esterase